MYWVYCTGTSTCFKLCREAYLKGCGQDGVYTIDPGCGKSFNNNPDCQAGRCAHGHIMEHGGTTLAVSPTLMVCIVYI